jgi:hypothetical protein
LCGTAALGLEKPSRNDRVRLEEQTRERTARCSYLWTLNKLRVDSRGR